MSIKINKLQLITCTLSSVDGCWLLVVAGRRSPVVGRRLAVSIFSLAARLPQRRRIVREIVVTVTRRMPLTKSANGQIGTIQHCRCYYCFCYACCCGFRRHMWACCARTLSASEGIIAFGAFSRRHTYIHISDAEWFEKYDSTVVQTG